jgi:D-glycero-D-manno-heptose 1,7-bisphosphate phosphatase
MKLVILDRDGVINYDSAAFIKTPEEWRPIPGSLEAIARLTQTGYRVVVATNQSGIARGLLDMAGLNAINDKMSKAVNHAGGRIDAMFFCPHANTDQCDCRKPATGMFRQIANRFDLELGTVPAIGDSLRDMQAASAAGAIPVLVLTGQGKKTSKESALPENTRIFPDLATAVDALIK